MGEARSGPKSYSTVTKATDVLSSFSFAEPVLGVSELARRLGMGKSTVYRLLTTLVRAGWVEQTPDSRYRLSLKVYELGQQVVAGLDLRDVAHTPLEVLRSQTGLTTHVAVLSVPDVVYVDRFESPGMVAVSARLGRRRPAHGSSAGKCLLAFGERAQVDAVVQAGLHAPRTADHQVALVARTRTGRGAPGRPRGQRRGVGGRHVVDRRPGVRRDRGLHGGSGGVGSAVRAAGGGPPPHRPHGRRHGRRDLARADGAPASVSVLARRRVHPAQSAPGRSDAGDRPLRPCDLAHAVTGASSEYTVAGSTLWDGAGSPWTTDAASVAAPMPRTTPTRIARLRLAEETDVVRIGLLVVVMPTSEPRPTYWRSASNLRPPLGRVQVALVQITHLLGGSTPSVIVSGPVSGTSWNVAISTVTPSLELYAEWIMFPGSTNDVPAGYGRCLQSCAIT